MVELRPLKREGEGKDFAPIEACMAPDGVVHFGYRDGISNPSLNEDKNSSDPGALNKFLIGYDTNSVAPPAPTSGKALEFAKDGCYVAFRLIHQDVAAFEHFLTQQGERVYQSLGLTLADAREWIAAKMMGRWRNGSPLMLSPTRPDEATRDADTFGYAEKDVASQAHGPDIQSGTRCPFSAHIRVTNPRDQKLEAVQRETPRLLRRGVPYGPPLTSKADDGKERGLVGLFLCGSLARQFELIMLWINKNDFSAVYAPDFNTQDGVFGNRNTAQSIVNTYTIPMPGKDGTGTGEPVQLQGLPSFVTTRGTAYTLLPSMATLRKLAGLG
jgi:Dyp-type peroxidase family